MSIAAGMAGDRLEASMQADSDYERESRPHDKPYEDFTTEQIVEAWTATGMLEQ